VRAGLIVTGLIGYGMTGSTIAALMAFPPSACCFRAISAW
jgi:hypothetical protein